MKKTLLIAAEVVLSAVVLAVITNIIANYVALPLGVAVLVCGGAVGGMIAISLYQRRAPEGPAPPLAQEVPPQYTVHIQSVHGLALGDQAHVSLGAASLPQPSAPPFQVPRDVPYFTGREPELAALERALAGGPVAAVCGVAGMGGIGKSALAAHFAALRGPELFPDGVLYATLRDSEPMLVLTSFAAAYRVDVAPYVDLPSRAAAVRSVLIGKRALVVLDNAEEVGAVRSVLPGCGDCAVLVTTRDVGLAAAVATGEILNLAELSEGESLDLLGKLVGVERVDTDRAAVQEVGNLLGHLPLALEIAGKLANLRRWGMGELLARLRDKQSRLKVLKVKDLAVRASFELSYALLTKGQQTLFAVLGAFRGLSFATPAVEAIVGSGVEQSLMALCDLSLLWLEDTGRFRQHPLLGDFAQEKLREAGREQAALGAHANYYLELALREHERLEHAETLVQAQQVFAAEFPQIEASWDWALEAGEDGTVANLAFALGEYFYFVGLYRSMLRWSQTGVEAVRRLGLKRNEGYLLNDLARAYDALGEVGQAIEHYQQALEIARETGSQRGEWATLDSLGNIYYCLEEGGKAVELHQQALEIAREIGDRGGEGICLGGLGGDYYLQGDARQAIDFFQQALVIAREVGDLRRAGSYLGNLGLAYKSLGEVERAIELHQQALEIAREIGDRRGETSWLTNLGLAYHRLGMVDEAEDHYHAALAMAEEIGHAILVAECSWHLGSLFYGRRGKLTEALALMERCVEIEEKHGLPDAATHHKTLEQLRQIPVWQMKAIATVSRLVAWVRRKWRQTRL